MSVQTMDVDENEEQPQTESLLETALTKLSDAGLKFEFMTFLKLVVEDRYPLDTLALRLFLETARFYSLTSSTLMWWWPETMRFWRTCYRLFHGKVIALMAGPRNMGQICEGEVARGHIDPQKAQVNFATPSLQTLSKEASDGKLGMLKASPPGMISSTLGAIQKTAKDTVYMMRADGKRVTAGANKHGGDVDMFGHEEGGTLHERKQQLEAAEQLVDSTISLVESQKMQPESRLSEMLKSVKLQITNKVKDVIRELSKRTQDAREMKLRQTFGLKKLLAISGDTWRDSKYQYAISGMQASIYQLTGFLESTLSTVGALSLCVCFLNGTETLYCRGSEVNASLQGNLFQLRDPKDLPAGMTGSQYVKQRTEAWHALRNQARVTGSTMHSAIGMRGLKAQKAHFDRMVCHQEVEVSDELQKFFDHGTKNEPNALATLVSRVLPTFYPDFDYIEEGCYIVDGKMVASLAEVAPDGSLRRVELDTDGSPASISTALHALEFKCPYPADHKVPGMYKLPKYYVCQCLAEMVVLGTHSLVFLSYSAQSATVFEVKFDAELWNLIWQEVESNFDEEHPVKANKLDKQLREIHKRIDVFVEQNVTLLGEVPSLIMTESSILQTTEASPYTYSWKKPTLNPEGGH